jgi:hypothetical protein
MADNVVAVWNKALSRIGTTRFVEAQDDDTVEAAICRVHWDDVVREVLAEMPWRFATRQAGLVELAGVTRVGWEHIYGLPVDFVSAVALLKGETRVTLTPPIDREPFEIVASDTADGLVLCCDLASDQLDGLLYVADIRITSIWPAGFVSAIAWRLAFELAMALTKDMSIADACRNLYEVDIRKAFAAELRGQREDVELEGSGIRARY